jgi:hypothetical protein
MGLKVEKSIASALTDKSVTALEAQTIARAATEESTPETQAQIKGLLGKADVAIGAVARRALNQTLPVDQRDRFDWGNRQPTQAERLWKTYFPNDAPPTDRATTRLLQLMNSVLTAGDNRAPLWDLECLLRLYKNEHSRENREANGVPSAPAFGDAYDQLKELEDAIGKTLEPSTDAERAARAKKLADLRQEKWTAGPDGKAPAIEKMLGGLSLHDFGSDADDDKLLRRAVLRQAKKIGTDDFQMGELQGDRGVHELRRQLRWVQYNTRVAATNGGPVVQIPPELTDAFNTAHNQLGVIKDRGEQAESRARALIEQSPNLSFHDARLKATQELGPTYSEEAITTEAKAIYEQMRSVYQRHKAVIEA